MANDRANGQDLGADPFRESAEQAAPSCSNPLSLDRGDSMRWAEKYRGSRDAQISSEWERVYSETLLSWEHVSPGLPSKLEWDNAARKKRTHVGIPLASLRFYVSRRGREDVDNIIQDLELDIAEMRQKGCTVRHIRAAVAWQSLVTVLRLAGPELSRFLLAIASVINAFRGKPRASEEPPSRTGTS